MLQAVGTSTDPWIQRLHDALDDVVDEWGDELKERVDDVNDGSWPNQTRKELVQETLKSVEFFIEGKLSGVDPRSLPQGVEILPTFGLLQLDASPDWTYIVLLRAFLNSLEGMQRRLVTVPAMILPERIPPEVRTYTVQATRCYFLGLFQAATVLARAALERALSDRLRGSSVAPVSPGSELLHLVQKARACQLLEDGDVTSADTIRLIGNRAAHGHVVQAEEAELCVRTVRGLIGSLYPGGGSAPA